MLSVVCLVESGIESLFKFCFTHLSRAVEQRRSSLQIILIIFAHLICFAKKEIPKGQKLRSGSKYLNCFGSVYMFFKLKRILLVISARSIFILTSLTDLDSLGIIFASTSSVLSYCFVYKFTELKFWNIFSVFRWQRKKEVTAPGLLLGTYGVSLATKSVVSLHSESRTA